MTTKEFSQSLFEGDSQNMILSLVPDSQPDEVPKTQDLDMFVVPKMASEMVLMPDLVAKKAKRLDGDDHEVACISLHLRPEQDVRAHRLRGQD